jgi:hypothetical protein
MYAVTTNWLSEIFTSLFDCFAPAFRHIKTDRAKPLEAGRGLLS